MNLIFSIAQREGEKSSSLFISVKLRGRGWRERLETSSHPINVDLFSIISPSAAKFSCLIGEAGSVKNVSCFKFSELLSSFLIKFCIFRRREKRIFNIDSFGCAISTIKRCRKKGKNIETSDSCAILCLSGRRSERRKIVQLFDGKFIVS